MKKRRIIFGAGEMKGNDSKNNIEYSIVIPVYNSEKTLDELYRRITTTFKNITENYEIILVDDYSSDGSWLKLQQLHEKDNRVKIIHLIRNFSQHNATMCGFNHCNGSYVIIMDDDLQNPPEEIPKLIEKINEGYMAVISKFKSVEHSKFRNFLSKTYRHLNNTILGLPKDFYITSFGIFKSQVIENIISIKSSYPVYSAYIFRMVPRDQISYVEVRHDKRKEGKSGYNLLKLFKSTLNLLINFSSIPLLFVGIFGLVISILSICFGIIIVIRKIIDPAYGIEGWNSLMVAMTFLGGTILMAITVLGEYMRRILREISYGQQYIIGEKRL